MHFNGLLNKVFECRSTSVDKRLHRTLLLASKTLCECKHLSIAGLGRHLKSSVAVKHVIKRMDRLFGNARLHDKREQFAVGFKYRASPGAHDPSHDNNRRV